MVITAATSSIVSALGGGSGIDMVGLASNLAVAQFEGRTTRLTTRAEALDRQISAAASLKGKLLELASALGDRVRNGDLSPQPAVANSAVASASIVAGTAPAGSFSLEVLGLAASQTLASGAFPVATSAVGAGTLTLRFGTVAGTGFTQDIAHPAVPITIPSGATLADVAAAINAAGAGVSAYVANTAEGAKLVLKGQEGAANGFTLEAAETPGEEGLAALAWDPASGTAARLIASSADARFKLDGLEMTSTTNSVAEPAPGLNLTLRATNIGAPTQITFANPSAAVTTAMQDLTNALNEIATELNAAVNPQNGDLARDSGARALRQMFSQLAAKLTMPAAANGAPRTLADLGLATTREGGFRLDGPRLASTLKADPRGAAAMFTAGLYGVFATIDGLARNATSVGNPGSLAGSITRYTAQQAQIGIEQTKLAEAQERLRAQLTARFSSADVRVGASKSTLSLLQSQIAAWNAQNN